jgi:hypothetical protein
MYARVIQDSVETDRRDHACQQSHNVASAQCSQKMSVVVSHVHLSVFYDTCPSPPFSSSGRQEPHRLISAPYDRTCAHPDTSLSLPGMTTTFPSQLMRDNHFAPSSAILPPDCSRVLELYTSVSPQYTSLPSSKNLPLFISPLLHVPGNRLTSQWSILMPPGIFNPSLRCHLSLNMAAENDHFSMPENS